jgi:hypothetical protein
MCNPMKGITMRKAMLMLAALAATMVAGPLATAQASYKVTSIKQIAPNTLKYLLSHYTGAASLETKIRAMEVKLNGKALILEGPEGKEGPAGATGARGESIVGPQGIPGDEGSEGAEGRASDIAGPQGPQGIPGESIVGPEGAEGAASTVPGPAGEKGERGERGPACEVKVEPACASTVPGPRGEKGETGPASTVAGPAGPAGPAGESITGPAGPRGPQGEAGPEGKGGGLPSTYTMSLGYTGKMTRDQEFTMFNRTLPPGDYLITGNLAFEDRHEGSLPEEIECKVVLGGTAIDKTLTITPNKVQPGRNPSSAIVVASTGELTSEERLEVKCEDQESSGAEEEFPQFGQMAATSVSFK